MEGGLLLGVSDVDGDLAGTIILQRRSRTVRVLNPLDGLRLTGLPGGGGNGGSGLYCVPSQRVRLAAKTRERKNPRRGTRAPGGRRSRPRKE